MGVGSKNAKGEKKKVEWSCRDCTKGAKRANRRKGHLNYASSDLCRECGEHKRDVHLCAFSDLDCKLREWNDRGVRLFQVQLAEVVATRRMARKGATRE